MNRQAIIDLTYNKFKESELNCSQSIVYAALKAQNKTEDQYMLIARTFGSGVGGLKETCGFITGACIAYTLILEPDSEIFKQKIKQVAQTVENIANSTQCSEITNGFTPFWSSERKAKCSEILLAVLDLIIDDFMV